MAKSIQQIMEENARMEHAANKGAAIGTLLVLVLMVGLPAIFFLSMILSP